MADSGLTAERILTSDFYLALATFSSTRDYRHIAEELAQHDIRLEYAPFSDGNGEIAARALKTMDVVLKQTTRRWKMFKRLVGIHRYLLALYLLTLLVVGLYLAISSHFNQPLSVAVIWWLLLGNMLGLISLGAIAQVDKNTLFESEKIEKLQQKRADFLNALKQLQSPELGEHQHLTRIPIRDEKGEMIIIRPASRNPKTAV